ncbi:MAG: 4Fe-4S dicluster domain-containing protein [Bacteroidales bacterium]
MKKKENMVEKPDRRRFLKQGLLLGGSAAIGGGAAIGSAMIINNGVQKKRDHDDEIVNKIRALTPGGDVIELDEVQAAGLKMGHAHTNRSMRKGVPGRKFVMVIDLSKCKNERKCQEGCRSMHFLPDDVNWLKVFKMQEGESTAPYWMPSPCYHCDNPPCVKVCPVDATFIREDGIVLIDNERCIGCRFCMAGCPYSARTFNWSEPVTKGEIHESEENCSASVPRKMGTVEKCDFCTSHLERGEFPKCVTSCPNGVFYMGDMNEDTVSNPSETIRFSELIESKAGYQFLAGLGTEPSVYYLPPANRLFPFEDDKKH